MADFAPIISINIFTVEPADFERLANRATEALGEAARLPGFVRLNIFGNALHTKLLLASEWQSEHAWSRTQWDDLIARVLTDLVENSHDHEFELYSHIAP
jgi:heme-degrading monooxygenase HmoA